MLRDVSCIVCEGTNYTQIYKSTYNGSTETAADYFLSHRKKVAHGQIVRCDNCGFVYTSPQFTPAEYDSIYQQAPKGPADSFNLQEAGNIRFSRLAKMVRQYVKPGPFLDLGCGTGGFLDVINDNRGLGFEVGQLGKRQSAKGHPIITGSFFDLQGQDPFTDEAFSFITAIDVFEHLPDLPCYLERLRLLIRADGHLVITVPNVSSVVAKLTGERWNMILLEHLWYFSPKTLRLIMERHGFEHVFTSSMPYEAPLSHVFNRFSQTYQMTQLTLPKWIGSFTIPVPIGLMASVFRRV